MRHPLIAIPSFPGSNGEVDNVRVLKRCGFDCFVFRWNDSLEKLHDVDGYFFGAGFSYEDRGRSGMVAARDPLFHFMHEEAEKGKVIVGNCNGAQVLVESGLIPLGNGLKMCLARNAVRTADGSWKAPGFLNEWVWITPACRPDRCATSQWEGVMQIPIAHGEGRFVTRDPDLIGALEESGQVAFRYCDAAGKVSPDVPITPNGSTGGIAGICNPRGNVVALMPHPERTQLGDPYFHSVRLWIERRAGTAQNVATIARTGKEVGAKVATRRPMMEELFIDTVITNNEERTVEQAARRLRPELKLKQYRYIGLPKPRSVALLSMLSFFNPHKEIAYVRSDGKWHKWNSDKKQLEGISHPILKGIALLRRDEPDVGAGALGGGTETGVCYDCREVQEQALLEPKVCEVFCNPHSSTLERLTKNQESGIMNQE
jgi:phosphoribosylformylglycinamidine synthase